MNIRIDPVDGAMKSLKSRQWPGRHHNAQLENALMCQFDTERRLTFVHKHRFTVSAIAVLLLASAGFAAAGGVEWVRSWFVTVSINGEVVSQQAVVANEDGSATFTVPLPHPEGDSTEYNICEIQLEGSGAAPDGTKTVNVSVSAEGEKAEVTITPEEQPGE